MEIQNISAEALDTLFGEVQIAQAADDKSKIIEDTVISVSQETSLDIPEIDLDALESLVDTQKDSTIVDTSKEIEDALNSNPDEIDDNTNVNNILKNTVDFMIQKGLWKDFDGRDELEMDEETYAKLASEQFNSKVTDLVQEVLDSTGEYGKAIISHIREGGNPDEIIDIFKEQQQITSIDLSTEEGKIEMVGKYYSDILGWKPERVTKHLKRIIEEKDLDTESTEIEEKYKEYYTNQLKEVENQNNARKAEQIENQKRFQSQLSDSLTELKYSDKDKKKIVSALLDVKTLPDGKVTTDFNLKFSEIQKDPKRLIKLVDYVLDEQNFINKIKTSEQSTANANAFSFIKGNATASKTKGSSHEHKENSNNNLDFSQILKNNK